VNAGIFVATSACCALCPTRGFRRWQTHHPHHSSRMIDTTCERLLQLSHRLGAGVICLLKHPVAKLALYCARKGFNTVLALLVSHILIQTYRPCIIPPKHDFGCALHSSLCCRVCRQVETAGDSLRCAAISPSGEALAFGGSGGYLHLWSASHQPRISARSRQQQRLLHPVRKVRIGSLQQQSCLTGWADRIRSCAEDAAAVFLLFRDCSILLAVCASVYKEVCVLGQHPGLLHAAAAVHLHIC
jgi:hypothetical protein